MIWAVRVGVLSLCLAICAADVRERRIPNNLVFSGLLLAMVWQVLGAKGGGLFAAAGAGALGFGQALGGAAVAFAAFLVLHVFRIMGAGDVKLMAFLGAVFGLAHLPSLILSIFATGGALAAVRLLDGSRRRRVIENLRLMLFGAASTLSGGGGPRFDAGRDTADRLPFAVAIVGGALVLAGLQWSGRVV